MKLSLILFFLIMLMFNLISILFDNLRVVKLVYELYWFFIFLEFIFLGLFVYIIVYELKTRLIYRGIFSKFINSRYSYPIFVGLLVGFVLLITLVSGIGVFSKYTCRNNNFDNCLIEQKSLRTIYIPNTGIYFLRKNEIFSKKDGNMIYFSALPDRY